MGFCFHQTNPIPRSQPRLSADTHIACIIEGKATGPVSYLGLCKYMGYHSLWQFQWEIFFYRYVFSDKYITARYVVYFHSIWDITVYGKYMGYLI
jgi:hypothetical protein